MSTPDERRQRLSEVTRALLKEQFLYLTRDLGWDDDLVLDSIIIETAWLVRFAASTNTNPLETDSWLSAL